MGQENSKPGTSNENGGINSPREKTDKQLEDRDVPTGPSSPCRDVPTGPSSPCRDVPTGPSSPMDLDSVFVRYSSHSGYADGFSRTDRSRKRSRDDLERGEEELRRQQKLADADPVGRADSYRPYALSFQYSPPNTRHAFIPDGIEPQNSELDTRRQDRGRQPFNGAWRGQKDHYSPPRRYSSLPRRPSAVRRQHSGPSSVPFVQPASSPPPVISQSGHERVDFNGLSGVPTGPKGALTGPKGAPTAPKLPPAIPLDVGSAVKRRPHIFISTRSLPSKVATIQHLENFLRHYKPMDVHIDQTGYFLVFEDTSSGKALLEMCFRDKNQQMLFHQYVLSMVRFPNGQGAPDISPGASNGEQWDSPGGFVSDGISFTRPAMKSPPFLDESEIAQRKEQSHDVPVAKDQPFQDRATELPPAEGSARSPTDTPLLPLHVSSPTHASSRQDKDDASSSVSGTTDLSASKLAKCHICQSAPVSDTDSLIQCASCPRRYHGRCHNQPPIPSNLDHESLWQCRRCVKKQVQPRSGLSNGALAAASSPVPSVGQSAEPPAKKRRLEGEEFVPAAEPQDSVTTVTLDASASHEESHDNSTISGPVQASFDSLAQGITERSDEARSHEAEALVEQSFGTLATESAESARPSHTPPQKLNLTRKKLAQASNLSPSQITKPDEDVTKDTPENDTEAILNEDQEAHDQTMTTPKKKRHKWGGTGADKDIIQAGRETLFGSDPSGNANEEHEQPDPAHDNERSVASTHRPDVPGSPEDTRVSTRNGDDAQKSSERQHSQPQTNGDVTVDAVDKEQSRPLGNEQPTPPHSPKSGKCSRCQRTVALFPSGSDQLCAQCKQDGSSAKKPVARKSAPNLPQKNNSGLNDPKSVANAPQNGRSKAPSPDDIAKDSPPIIDEPTETPRMSPVTKPPQAKPRKSCADCRTLRKYCTHRALSSATTMASRLPKNSSPSAADNVDVDDTSADLDFWSPASPKPNGDEVHHHVESYDAPGDGKDNSRDESPLSASASSSPVDELYDVPATPVKPQSGKKKRKSHTVAAKDENDLGNSFQRPPKTYSKLITMALIDSPDHRRKGGSVVNWVASNIPNYKQGEGNNWENGLRATMSLNKEGNKNGVRPLWKYVEDKQRKTKTPSGWYELLPGLADELLQWDPVLKVPRSPLKFSSSQKPKAFENDPEPAPESRAAYHEPQVSTRSTGRKRKKRVSASATEVAIDSNVVNIVDQALTPARFATTVLDVGESSSDEEPLIRSRHSKASVPSAIQTPNGAAEADAMEIDELAAPSPAVAKHATRRPIPKARVPRETPRLDLTDQVSLAQLIKRDAEDADFSAKSLFVEWPEYDPDNVFDRKAKIAEIEKRPTRKQRIGRPSRDPWAEWKPERLSRDNLSGGSLSVKRQERTARGSLFSEDPYPWENGEVNVEHCETVEQLFDLPSNPLAIIHDGQIAYRDGERSTLKRAQKIFNTGYV